MSQLPEAARKEIPAVGMRKQLVVAEDLRTMGGSSSGEKPEARCAVSKMVVFDGFGWIPKPASRYCANASSPIHATDRLLPQRQVPRNRKRGEAAASVYKPNAKGTEPSTFPPTLASVANDSLGPRLFVKVGTPAWRAVERFRPSPPKPRSTDLGRIRLGGTATVELMERKRKGVLKKFWD